MNHHARQIQESEPRSIPQLLVHLRGRGIRIWVEDQDLCVSASKTGLPTDLRAELKQRKSEIISFLKKDPFAPSTRRQVIQPVPRDGSQGVSTMPIPLSFAQQRMWFLNQFEGQDRAYILSLGFRLLGRLNPIWLIRGIQAP